MPVSKDYCMRLFQSVERRYFICNTTENVIFLEYMAFVKHPCPFRYLFPGNYWFKIQNRTIEEANG